MATHSSVLAWRVPWTEEPGGLQSIAHSTVHSTELAMTEELTLQARKQYRALTFPKTSGPSS